jgi:hypothetical protein
MPYTHNTYDRRILLGASRQRLEDAKTLVSAQRWAGAMYLGGYAIECSLKSLLCHLENTDNLENTPTCQNNRRWIITHNLANLYQIPGIRRIIQQFIAMDRSKSNKNISAWHYIVNNWQTNELRYWDDPGDQHTSEQFLDNVVRLYKFILEQQGEEL